MGRPFPYSLCFERIRVNPVTNDGTMSTDTLTSDRVGWVVSKVVVVVRNEPRVTQRGGNDDGSGYGVIDGSQDSWVGV